jgi:hypothetical protein
MTALTALVDTSGIYYTSAVYTRVKRDGTILAINKIQSELEEGGAQIEFYTGLLNGQIDVAIDQLQREMGCFLQTPTVRDTILSSRDKKYRLNANQDAVEEDVECPPPPHHSKYQCLKHVCSS